jgi:Leucine-rich repeat (LRR) protein
MLRRTSKKVKDAVDKMRLPAVVRLSRSFWDDARNGTGEAKLEFVFMKLAAMSVWCQITTLELPFCEMKGQDAEKLAGVLAQCPALVHLDVSRNRIGVGGTERLAEVLGQCPALAYLNLRNNQMGDAGTERLGVLAQCPALAHLNLSDNRICEGCAESLAGVLAQCPALAYLNLLSNDMGTVGKGRLRASWRGQDSGLRL